MRYHGLSYHPLYGRWYRMVRRCTVPTDPAFKNYGGRGIGLFAEWLDPAVYIGYVEAELGPRPSPAHSIDRVDNDGGYEPGNLRWATRSVQNTNQRQRRAPGYPLGASGHRGVRQHRNGLWQARVHRGGRDRSLGYFRTAELAAQARREFEAAEQ